ncbi:Hypothetical protein CINCED_3A011196 [Cinara cedri]|nr:Hypothetical protein CINCED_3A011196 [Cinara cedri]
MKIFVLTIVIFALNGYVTRASSLDPTETFEMEDMMNNSNEDTRNKRSGSIFSSLMNKKLKLLGSLSGSSSSKSMGHPSGHSGHFEQPPLSYHTKSFDLWGVKKAIFSSVLQAAKAITGGVIALKGQLIKAKGHVVVAKGKLLQNKGQAISNFGQTIATHAFDEHHEQPPPAHSSVGLYNHLPATPVHQPTSYGAPSAMGYQEQVYSNNGYQPDAGYHGSPRYPTAPASTGYEGGASDYSGLGGGNGYSGKRAVQNDGHKPSMNQLTGALEKDTVRAGLLLFKPIKLPHGTTGGGSSAFQNSGLEHLFSQRPADVGKIFSLQNYKTAASQETINLPSPFPGFQGTPTQNGGGYSSYQAPTYVMQQNTGYPSQGADYPQFPPNSAGGTSDSGERVSAAPNQYNGYGFQGYKSQESTIGQELGSQTGGGFSGHQLQSYSQENGYDQNESASVSQEHDAQATYTVSRSAESPRKPKPSNTGAAFTKSERFVADFFLPTTPKDNSDRHTYTKKRSVAKNGELATLESVEPASIVPLTYDSDTSRAAEEQAKLKQTVQRFFSILQQQR